MSRVDNRVQLVYFFLAATLTGCGHTLSTPIGDAERVVLELNRNSKKYYTLRTTSGERLATTTPDRRVLSFDLPQEKTGSACLVISDEKGEHVSFGEGDRISFFNPRWVEYLDVKERLSHADLGTRKRETAEKAVKARRLLAEENLKGNRAFKRDSCVKPTTGRLPPRPSAACESEQVKEKATALCLASAGGPEACSLAANALGSSLDIDIANFLVSPACGKLVADALGEKYTPEQLLGDVALGLGWDIAEDLLESDSILANLVGVIVGGSVIKVRLDRFNSCVSRAAYLCRSRYRAWVEERRRIVNMPEEQLASCRVELAWFQWSDSRIEGVVTSLETARRQAEEVRVLADKIRGRSPLPLPACPQGSAARWPLREAIEDLSISPRQYRMGVSVKDAATFTFRGESYSYGARVVRVVTGMPAEQAGLMPGDVIHRIGDENVANSSDLIDKVGKSQGEALEIAFVREDRARSVVLKPVGGKVSLGAILEETLVGPRVAEVTSGSPAAQAGLQNGDFILFVDNIMTDALADVERAAHASEGRSIGLVYYRNQEAFLTALVPEFVIGR